MAILSASPAPAGTFADALHRLRTTAQVRADKTRTLGQAQANTVAWVEGEKAKGFELKTAAFGDPTAYTLWEFANNLNQDVRVNILHAVPGTLWTDLEKATLGELGGAAVLDRK